MKFSIEEVNGIWNLISGILHFGNVEFDDSTLDNAHPCTIIEKDNELKTMADQIGVNYENLKNALLFKTRNIGGQKIKSEQSKIDCLSNRF